MRFDTKKSRGGCCSKNHLIDLTDSSVVDSYSIIKKRMNKIIEPFIKPEGLGNTKQIKQINIGETEDATNEDKLEISKEKSTDILIEMYTVMDNKNKGADSDEDEDEDSLCDEDQDSNVAVPTSTTNANANASSKVARNTSNIPSSIPKSNTPLNKPPSASTNNNASTNATNPKQLNNSK